jgi:hypothetical protein
VLCSRGTRGRGTLHMYPLGRFPTRERGGAFALGGRRFININNNQMEDGVDVRGCVGEEARPGRSIWGGRLPIIWGWIFINKTKREMGGPLALDDRRLMGKHNNQPKFGINSGRGIEEERRPKRNVWGGLSPCSRPGICHNCLEMSRRHV